MADFLFDLFASCLGTGAWLGFLKMVGVDPHWQSAGYRWLMDPKSKGKEAGTT
jgi:hypothetical protein